MKLVFFILAFIGILFVPLVASYSQDVSCILGVFLITAFFSVKATKPLKL